MAGASAGPPRRRRDIVVLGASAGGVEALERIVGGLPATFGAAVFVVLHLPEGSSTALPGILDRAGPLPASAASSPRPVEPGTITVAPPDHHLVFEDGGVRARRGPKINGHRPAVDVLFHSAARTYRERVVGVILSGALTDGTLGLRAIKRRGGVAVVQADAAHEGMPTSALENVAVDAVLPLLEIPEALTMFVGTKGDSTADEAITESGLEAGFDVSKVREPPEGAPSVFRCPECGGAMWDLVDGDFNGYACHVGHTYSADGMLGATDGAVERALWSSVRMLEEKAALAGRLRERMRIAGNLRSSERFELQAHEAAAQADLIRSTLLGPGRERQTAAR